MERWIIILFRVLVCVGLSHSASVLAKKSDKVQRPKATKAGTGPILFPNQVTFIMA
ncbi:MAG: hypothetical protein HRU09_15670 [Oligoflexales bacterium]|nr:hypothetical protein [Oligoflexales bacterium]